MQFSLTAIASALVAGNVLAAPAPAPAAAPTVVNSELDARQDNMKLPHSFILWAMVDGENILGCLNGGGNFTRYRVDYPFISYPTTQNNGVNANIYGQGDYYGNTRGCSIGSGPLEGARVNCRDGDQSHLGQFWKRDGYLSIDGPTGTAFSIDSWPDAKDEVGVPLIVGGSGKYMQFKLFVKYSSG